jgi:hypothetical protein
MTSFALSKKMVFLTSVGLIVLFAATFLTRADTPSSSGLSIDTEYARATYKQTDEGDSFQVVFTIINSGQTDATIVTENLDRGLYGIDKDSNSLRCTLSFREPLKYKEKYTVIPSIYKCSPVTLRPGEVAQINYYEDRSKAKSINYKPILDKEDLQAANVIITYEIPTSWGKRLDLWQGQIRSAPVKFTKRISNGSIK